MQRKGNYVDNSSHINQTYIENVDKLIFEGQGSCLEGIKVLLKSRNFDGQLMKLKRMKLWAILLPTTEVILVIVYLMLVFKFPSIPPHQHEPISSPFIAYLLPTVMQFLFVALIVGAIVNLIFFAFRPNPQALYDYLDYLDTVLHSAVGRCNDLDEALNYIKEKREELNKAYRLLPAFTEKLRRA